MALVPSGSWSSYGLATRTSRLANRTAGATLALCSGSATTVARTGWKSVEGALAAPTSLRVAVVPLVVTGWALTPVGRLRADTCTGPLEPLSRLMLTCTGVVPPDSTGTI